MKIDRVPIHEIDKILRAFENNGKEFCLDIGGYRSSDKYQIVNIRDDFDVDIHLDIRCCFAPLFSRYKHQYPDAEKLQYGHYKLIRCSHVVEHIEWIHQESLFRWLRSLLSDGGALYIATPNLEYISREYITSLDRYKSSGNFHVRTEDHPYLSNVPCDITRWLNSKFNSGCSTDEYDFGKTLGDYHIALYDSLWLSTMMCEENLSGGFDNILINDETVNLVVIGTK